MAIEIRGPEPDEYRSVVDVMTTAFLERPPDLERMADEMRTYWQPGRTWVAWDGPRACGTFRSWGTQLTVPGGATLPTAAVSAVTVLPTHRRRGILGRMAAAEHAAIRERGEAFAVLLASEYPIYGRFGYAPATRKLAITVRPREAGVLPEATGSVELVPAGEALPLVRDVFDVARLRRAGEIWRRDVTWELHLGLRPDVFSGEVWKGFLTLHRDAAGTVDGFVRYKTDSKWERGPEGVVDVQDLHALTDRAYADLWRFLLSIDLVATVRAEGRPVSEPLPWLLGNARAAALDDLRDGMWVRVFDIPRALEARSYAATGSLVLEIVDEPAWGGTRRWRLEAGPDGAACRPTDEEPDLTLPVAALGGAYLGGNRLRDVVRATGADEHRPDALAEADALFRTADEPWCSTGF